jgi:hypothetical protein
MTTETRIGADIQPNPNESLADIPLPEEQANETKAGGLTKVGLGHLTLPNPNS